VEWVQIGRGPALVAGPAGGLGKAAYESVYNLLQRAPLKKLVANLFLAGLEGLTLGWGLQSAVDALHVDSGAPPGAVAADFLIACLPIKLLRWAWVSTAAISGAVDLSAALALLERQASERWGREKALGVEPVCFAVWHRPGGPAVVKEPVG